MMGARTMSLGTHEIDFLKETLNAQQELLQKLYNELDMERESSATAADEALSMILRLQGEKAALEMEASQYKRIAEEKMCHAQETLDVFQEITYQKEMQIASLEFQVQAYRFKLVSMGCEDLGTCEMQYPENMLSRRKGFVGETESSTRRGNSLPVLMNGALSRRASTVGVRSGASSPKMLQESKGAESSIRREHTTGDFSSYWEEIKKLDGRVKEFTFLNNMNGFLTSEGGEDTSEFCSSNPPVSTTSIRDPSLDSSPVKLDFCEYSEKVLNVPTCGDSCPTIIQDVFEVPECVDNHHGGTSHKKEKPKLSLEKESRNEKLDSVWGEIWKSDVKEKVPLLSSGSDISSLELKEAEEKTDWEKKPLLSQGSHVDSLPKPKDGKTPKHMLFKHPTIGVADFELQQFNRRLKQLEDERFETRGRKINLEASDEELRLLKEIMEKVESLQAEITRWRCKKPRSPEDRLGCFKEVMQCFLP